MRRIAHAFKGAALLLVLGVPGAGAQQLPIDLPVPMEGVTGYDAAIPTPEAVLGHRIGTRHTRPAQLVEYFHAVAESSPRVRVEEYARSHQGRPLIVGIVTSSENHGRLEEIRRNNLRLSDAPDGVTDQDIESMPTIVYMGYGVHGNEGSTSETAVLLLYHLAAGNGPAVREILDSTVILIDPSLNPDGRSRFVEWVNNNRSRVPTTDSQDREHNQGWPNGRTNHYMFDLNRDWVPVQQPEALGRLRLYHRWRPQLHADYHEMGGEATYFFQPGVPSRDNPNTPASVPALTGEVAEFHARNLDRIGALYFAREAYDDFYYGKGSTYPDVNGAIGILYEQGTPFALQGETPFGLLTYAYTIRSQFLTTLATVEAGARMRATLLSHQRDFYAGAPAFASGVPVRAYVIGTDPDPTRARELVGVLLEHRIRVHELASPLQAGGEEFRPGSAYVVPVDQPQARLVQGLLERRTTFADSIFYDVSSWTLPLAYGLRYAEVTRDPSGLIGGQLQAPPENRGELVGGHSEYAYILEAGSHHAYRAVQRLLEAGVRPLAITIPIAVEVEGRRTSFAPGDFIIPAVSRDQRSLLLPRDVQALVDRIVEEDAVRVHAVHTGLTTEGFDLGSRSWQVIQPPRVAILAGRGANGLGLGSHQVGEAWHLLNHRVGVPASLVDVPVLGSGDLSRYDVILMTTSFEELTTERGERLRRWVEDGGLLIVTDRGASWAAGQPWIGVELREVPSIEPGVPFVDVPERAGAQAVGGAIVSGRLDTTHPVAFGYEPGVILFKGNRQVLVPLERSGETVALFDEDPLVSGYLSAGNKELIGGGAALVARRVGAGRVIVFTDNPAFRGFWKGTERLLLNAVFLGRGF